MAVTSTDSMCVTFRVNHYTVFFLLFEEILPEMLCYFVTAMVLALDCEYFFESLLQLNIINN